MTSAPKMASGKPAEPTAWQKRLRPVTAWRQFTQGQTVTGFGQGLPDPELVSMAPDDTVLENFKSRMIWIDLAAKKFHGLMQTKKYFMEHQLQTIASWVGHQDDQIVTPTMPL